MTDPKKKGPNVLRGKLAPEQLVTLCLTLRDRWGSPIPTMKMEVRQAGAERKAPGGGSVVTDAAGRADIDKVTVGTPLDVKLDDQFLPADAEDRRNTRYVYSIEEAPNDVIELEVDDDPSGTLAIVDTRRAFVTIFAGVGLFRPVFRFPWQNPVHSEPAENRIYKRRLANLRAALTSLFPLKSADVDGLDHDGLVAKLVELFERSQAVAAAEAAVVPTAPSSSPNLGTQPEPAPPSQPPPPPPPSAPGEPPASLQSAERLVPVRDATPPVAPPPVPPPSPPANAPNAGADSTALPRWVWYLLFHHVGLRYAPPTGRPPPDDEQKSGAHGCYVKPALILARLRELEIEASFGANGPKPSTSDVTEALVLIERGKAPAALRAALVGTDAAKTKKALAAIFSGLKVAEMARLDAFRTPDKFYDGDYVALGSLKAKRLKSKASLTDAVWRQVTSHTQLRNDVQAHGWDDIPPSQTELKAFLGGVDIDQQQWRTRRGQTLDTILTSAVCDQTSETADLVRSGTFGLGIPGNAAAAKSLQYLTFENAKQLRRGMHFFYTGFGLVRGGEQPYLVTDNFETRAIFASELDPADPKKKAKLQKLTPMAEVGKVETISDLDALLDPDDPSNNTATAENVKRNVANERLKAGQKQALVPRVMVAPDRAFTGARFINGSLLENGAKTGALVRCEKDPADGKIRLHACKWTHQEIVIDVKISPTRIQVFLFSTAADPNNSKGTGIRAYTLTPAGAAASFLNVLFGFTHPLPNEKVAILDACFLNPRALKRT